jgi:hypothetical protein
MRRGLFGALAISVLGVVPASAADLPVSLRGSNQAMVRQHSVAVGADYPFARTPSHMALLEAQGELVRLYGNDDYGFRAGVRSLLARPETKTFIERLGKDYRAACGEPLVVTSLTRPMSLQPRNSHRLSVHPAGIAVDLRVSRSAACRSWLEDALMTMEGQGLLDGIRERHPPHYHVALFPEAYMAHIAPIVAAERSAERAQLLAERLTVQAAGAPGLDVVADPTAPWRLAALAPLAFLVVFLLGLGRRQPWRP